MQEYYKDCTFISSQYSYKDKTFKRQTELLRRNN